jgi:hypothetical protein
LSSYHILTPFLSALPFVLSLLAFFLMLFTGGTLDEAQVFVSRAEIAKICVLELVAERRAGWLYGNIPFDRSRS